jgi:triosephosphate isomerase
MGMSMEKKPRPLIAGNWKMNGLKQDMQEIGQLSVNKNENCDILICLPFTLLPLCFERFGALFFGGQDCHAQSFGAFTGDISAPMLKDAGASYVIVGHSERRRYHHETDSEINAKAKAAIAAGLTPIICVGETLEQRKAGEAQSVTELQLRQSIPTSGDIVIAYEPVWAIGTGLNASIEDIAIMHGAIRKMLQEVRADAGRIRLLYGGSVKGANATEILNCENVNGALVGGASLKAKDFLEIIAAVPQ